MSTAGQRSTYSFDVPTPEGVTVQFSGNTFAKQKKSTDDYIYLTDRTNGQAISTTQTYTGPQNSATSIRISRGITSRVKSRS